MEPSQSAVEQFSRCQTLTTAQQEHLAELLDEYLIALEQGVTPDPDEIVRNTPELAEPFKAYLESLNFLQAAAVGLADVPEGSPDEPFPLNHQGSRLGDFEIIREIGKGGMGIVYEARQLSLDRRVALKVLPFAALLNSKQIIRFKNEAQAAAQLHHPNIVPVHAVGIERGVHYFAMQFIDGQPLDRVIDELRRQSGMTAVGPEDSTVEYDIHAATETTTLGLSRSTREAFADCCSHQDVEYFRGVARLGIQAAEALHAAHEYGIVHRDIKPSNLLLNHSGKLWVTDFGLARFQTDASLTNTGEIVGTVNYMSPEQALGQSALVDHRTDVYSLGATLYELMTFHRPWEGNDHASLMRHMSQDEPRKPGQFNPQIPRDLENIILKAIAKSREDRYATAAELADDLNRFLEGRPTIAKPPRLLDRAAKWARRHRKSVVAAVAMLSLATISLLITTVLVAQAKLQTDAALTQSKQNFNESKRNLDRATAHFRQARRAVDQFGAQLADKLADVPGAEGVRRELLEDTLDYYQDFIKQSADDPSIRADLATTYMKIGAITNQIGSGEDALLAYAKSAKLLERLIEDEPAIKSHQAILARCENNRGLLLSRLGRAPEGELAFQKAIHTQAKLVQGNPHDTQLRAELALSYNNLGLLFSRTGDTQAAEQAYRTALSRQKQIANAEAENIENLRNLAGTYNNLSSLYVATQPQHARKWLLEALRIQHQLAESQPTTYELQSELALSYNNLGSLQLQLKEFDDSIDSHQRAVRIQQQLVNAAPMMTSFRRDLAISHNNLGLAQGERREYALADQSFREALTLQAALIEDQPHEIGYVSSIGGMYNNLGMVLQSTDRIEDAIEAYAHAVKFQGQALERAPQVSRFREFLSKHYYNYSNALRQLQRYDDALDITLARKQLWPDHAERLLSVAREFALLHAEIHKSALTADTPADEALSQESRREAIAALKEAIDAGFTSFQSIEDDRAFDVLRNLPEYARLVGKR